MALGLRGNKLERGDVAIVKGVGNKGATTVSAMVPAAERGIGAGTPRTMTAVTVFGASLNLEVQN